MNLLFQVQERLATGTGKCTENGTYLCFLLDKCHVVIISSALTTFF